MRIVLVEEDRWLREIVRRMVAGRATALAEVTCASESPGVVATTAPDVVLLAAVDFAGDQGTEMLRRLREARPTARLLLLGARPPSGQRRRPDVDGFLPYPFSTSQLNRTIDLVLEQAPAGSPGR